MKSTKLVALGIVGLTVLSLGGQISQAAPKSIDATTTGKVKFSTETEEEETGNPTGPGTVKPEKVPGGTGNTSDPDLKILFAPNFVFGNVDAEGNFEQGVKYDTKKGNTFQAMKQDVKVYDEEGNFVKQEKMDNFTQIFNSDQVTDWTLSVKADDFTCVETPGKTQPKMTMSVAGTTMGTGASQYGEQASVTNADFVLGNDAKVIGGLADTKGDGAINSFMFPNVTLNVPQGLGIEDNETYISNITWTLAGNVK